MSCFMIPEGVPANITNKKTELLKKIKEEVLGLKKSPLYEYRVQNKSFPVIGEGSHDVRIMFIGEAPGKNEALTGRPFCGASGRVLDELLAHVGLKREDVYVTNIVKDRPPENRDPTPAEIEMYGPYLDRQIEIIQPKVLATLGRFSMQYVMEKFGLGLQCGPISEMHGREFTAKTSYGEVIILSLYHPAVAIYNIHQKETLMKDFEMLEKHSKRP